MTKQQIKRLISERIHKDGLSETGVEGVKLFRATSAIPCAPAVYEPSIIAVVSGSKEVVLDGKRHVYDNSHYLCCASSMPVTAGTPEASPDTPLVGIYISLDQRVMTELVMALDGQKGMSSSRGGTVRPGIWFSEWTETFSDAVLRLVQLGGNPTDTAALGAARLREVYYAVLQGDAGPAAREAFAPGSAIARSIAHLFANLSASVTIDELAARAGMSRAVFHRKFKAATNMSPLQFVKAMRLNSAAMKIARGQSVNEAAVEVGYISPSQFSREFKRMHGQSPRRWGNAQSRPVEMA